MSAQLFQVGVRFRQVFAARPLALVEVRDGVEPQAVDADLEPVVDDGRDGSAHVGALEVQIGLVGEEAMPVVRLRDRIPGPIRGFVVPKDDARVGPALRVVAPDVVVAVAAIRRRTTRALEPRVRVGGVVQDELGDDLQVARVRRVEQPAKVVEVAERRGARRSSRRCRSRRP